MNKFLFAIVSEVIIVFTVLCVILLSFLTYIFSTLDLGIANIIVYVIFGSLIIIYVLVIVKHSIILLNFHKASKYGEIVEGEYLRQEHKKIIFVVFIFKVNNEEVYTYPKIMLRNNAIINFNKKEILIRYKNKYFILKNK